MIAFLCQQAVEKLLKAYLVHRGITPEYTHDIRRLVAECAKHDPSLAALADDAEPLSLFAMAARYPGPPEPTEDEVREALAVVERVWENIMRRIPGRTQGA